MAEIIAPPGTWEFFNQGQGRRRGKLNIELPSPAEAHGLVQSLNFQFAERIHEAARIICGRYIVVGDGKIIGNHAAKPTSRREAAYDGLDVDGIIRPFAVLNYDDRLAKRKTTIKLAEPCLVFEVDAVQAYKLPPPDKTQMFVPLLNLSHVISLE
jgi:hypothetical protein